MLQATMPEVSQIAKLDMEKDRLQVRLNNQQTLPQGFGNASSQSAACLDGDQPADCMQLADTYLQPGSRYNAKAAINAYRQACSKENNMLACEKLGLTYASKPGNWDLSAALPYLDQACDSGEDTSCQHAQQVKMLRQNQRNCNLGKYESCALLGEVYSSANTDVRSKPNQNLQANRLRQYVNVDDKVAFDYLNKACNGAHNADACYYVAGNYRTGLGTHKNFSRAFNLYKRYCEGAMDVPPEKKQKEWMSCYYLGEMYQKGQGVEKSKKLAFHFYDLACNEHQGADIACESLSELRSQ